jgi:serine phosphatase RsbU (regulator of sigma subunit)
MTAPLIGQAPLFTGLPDDELQWLADTLTDRHAPTGTILFREGETGDRFYIIVAGRVEIVKALGTEDERRLALRGPGEFIGEMSLLNPDGLRTATARVHEDTRLLELSRADFDALLRRQPQLGYSMVRVLSTRLNNSHNDAIRDLHKKNQQLTEAYHQLAAAYAELQAAQAQLIEKQKLERELEMAREIQQNLLPRTLPHFPGFDFGALMLPALAVGGDLFDFIPLDDGRMGIVVADVSESGMPAAIFMGLARSLLRVEAGRVTSPRVMLRTVNRHLLGMNESGMFVTVLYGVLDGATRTFTYARAGHTLPLVLDELGEALPVTYTLTQPLGLLAEPLLDEQSVMIPPGGTLLLYTDGVTDAMDDVNESFGLMRLQTHARDRRHTSAQSLCSETLQAVIAHTHSTQQFDDMTLVVVRAS